MTKGIGCEFGRGIERGDARGEGRDRPAAGSKRGGREFSSRDVGRRGRRDVNAIREGPGSWLRLFGVGQVLGRLLLSASRSAVGAAVFLDELHGGVVLGCILELLDRLVALFLQPLELSL